MPKYFLLPLLAALLAAGSAWWSSALAGLSGASPPTAAVYSAQSSAGQVPGPGPSAQGGVMGDPDGGATSGLGGEPGSGPTTQGGVIADPDG